jgi:sugar phosphate isomerase/epimerase
MKHPILWAALASLLACASQRAQATEIWLSGVDPFVRHVTQPDERSDYQDLFAPDAPWRAAAAQVAVFKTSTEWVRGAPDEALRQMFDDLRRRGIALGMEALMTPGGRQGQCGQGIEGYSAPGAMRAAADRIKQLGGELAAVAMDEPLWFGHHDQEPHACQSSIADLARLLAQNVSAIHAVFPAAQIGDIEPVTAAAGPGWVDDIIEFAAAYQAATGIKLAFVHADVNWREPWQRQLRELAGRLHAAGVGFGIIYNGDPQDQTGVAWTAHAEQRFETVETDPALRPDQAILQTWMRQPEFLLPETRPGTMTNLVVRYARPVPRLELRREGGRVFGRLTDPSGRPLPDASVRLVARDAGGVTHMTVRHLADVVPEGAEKGLIGVRINTECDCSGSGQIGLGAVTYMEDGGEKVVLPTTPGTARAERAFRAVAGHPVTFNTASFAAHPGRRFTLEVPMSATPDARDSGYLALIFLDAQGKESRRDKLAFLPSEFLLAEPRTDADGRFSVRPAASAMDRDAAIVATYPGSDQLRPATAEAR